jgi:hypothetical protein
MPPDRPRPAWRAALLVWVVGLVLLGGKVLLWPHRHTVYPIFAGAGRHWAEGAPLYDVTPGPEPYRYSPLVAAFFVPFARLPDGPAGLLWRMLGAGVFLGGLAWWCRAVLPPLPRARLPLLWLLPAPMALGNVHNGQANLLVLGLLLVAVAALRRGRPSLAAACLAVACLFKLYPIAVGLLLVLLYPRLGPRLALTLALGFLLPFVLQRPDYVAGQYADWLRHMAGNDRQLLSRDQWYRDARLLCSRWVTPMSYRAYQVTEVAGGAVTAAACLWARRTGWPAGRLAALALGLGCCWMTALGPATESATYVLLGPTAAWLLVSAGPERHPRGLRALWRVGYALLIGSQAASLLPFGLGRQVHTLGPQPLAALLFLGGLLYLAFRDSPKGAMTSSLSSLPHVCGDMVSATR